MAGNGDFRETGFIDTLDPRTRKRMPNPSIELPPDAQAGTIEVRYVDASGDMQGPFPIKFDPEAALIRDQRKILDMTATSWLSFRQFNGLLVYYTHLVSYRCAIREVRIGIDTAVPDKVLKMPPCDLRDPSAITAGMLLYREASAGNAVHVGRIDLPRRQRVGGQEVSHGEPQQQLSIAQLNMSRPSPALQSIDTIDAAVRVGSWTQHIGSARIARPKGPLLHRRRRTGRHDARLSRWGAPASMSWCWRSTPISSATFAATPCIPRRSR